MRIVLISGRKRSGKDSIAKALVEQLGAHRIAFADPLKDYVSAATGIERELFEDPHKGQSLYDLSATTQGFNTIPKEWHFSEMTPRQLLQGFGTTARKQFREDFWIQQWWRIVDFSAGAMVVAPDVRFFNELALNLSPRLPASSVLDVFRLRVNRVDRQGRHAFEDNATGKCRFRFGAVLCDLPAESHPSHFYGDPTQPLDRHPSETELPDSGIYDAVVEAASAEGAATRGLEVVKQWLAALEKNT